MFQSWENNAKTLISFLHMYISCPCWGLYSVTVLNEEEEDRAERKSPSSHAEWLFGQLEASLQSEQRASADIHKSFDRSSSSDVTWWQRAAISCSSSTCAVIMKCRPGGRRSCQLLLLHRHVQRGEENWLVRGEMSLSVSHSPFLFILNVCASSHSLLLSESCLIIYKMFNVQNVLDDFFPKMCHNGNSSF